MKDEQAYRPLRNFWACCCAVSACLVVIANRAGAQTKAGAPLTDLYKPRDYTSERIVSVDPTGGATGKQYGTVIRPGYTLEIASIAGPAIISHVWFTLSPMQGYVLDDFVLRVYWDGEITPSIEAPIGLFFGQGHGRYYSFDSLAFGIGNERGVNCYLPMPFRKSARITLQNQGASRLRRLFYHIDMQRKPVGADALYLHAQYRQARPTSAPEDFTAVEARGKGHFVGLFCYVKTNGGGWWGDGGERMLLDGKPLPATGIEDYFGSGWGFAAGSENRARFGVMFNETKPDGTRVSLYRWHLEDAIAFQKSFQLAFKHGARNERRDDYEAVSFWYQNEPHLPFPALPPAALRRHEPPIPDKAPVKEKAEN